MFIAFFVHKKDFRIGSPQKIFDFFFMQRVIDRNDDRTGKQGTHVHGCPFRRVFSGNGDTVALFYSLRRQPLGQPFDFFQYFSISECVFFLFKNGETRAAPEALYGNAEHFRQRGPFPFKIRSAVRIQKRPRLAVCYGFAHIPSSLISISRLLYTLFRFLSL